MLGEIGLLKYVAHVVNQGICHHGQVATRLRVQSVEAS